MHRGGRSRAQGLRMWQWSADEVGAKAWKQSSADRQSTGRTEEAAKRSRSSEDVPIRKLWQVGEQMVMVMVMIAYRVKSAEVNRSPWRLGSCALISLTPPSHFRPYRNGGHLAPALAYMAKAKPNFGHQCHCTSTGKSVGISAQKTV